MADSDIAIIDFHGDQLLTIRQGSEIFVAISPICQVLGISVRAQRKRIENDLILAEGRIVMVLPLVLGGQETTLLNLNLVNGWLFGIDARRVKDDARERVLTYQRECYRVLRDHFFPHQASVETDSSERVFPGAIGSVEVYEEKRRLVETARHTWGVRHACEVWLAVGLPVTPSMLRGPDQGELPLTLPYPPAAIM